MSYQENIHYHMEVISAARQLPVGSLRRMELISRSIQGILRAQNDLKQGTYSDF